MRNLLTMMAVSLAVSAKSLRHNEAIIRQEDDDYQYYMAIPADRRIKVMNGWGYSPKQAERLLKRLESARSRASQQYRLRTHVNRSEARAVHLARMFIKGVPYKMVEEVRYSEPRWDRVMELVSLVSKPIVKAPSENKTPNEANEEFIRFNNWRMGN